MFAEQARFPGRAPIDAYGDGGFRFADMSHRGSILIVPSGIYAWPVETLSDVRPDSFTTVLAEADSIEFMLFGTGDDLVPASEDVAMRFAEAGIGLEVMATGAAARTYNVLLGEERRVAAALIAVEGPC